MNNNKKRLKYQMFLKLNNVEVTTKGRGLIDGIKQLNWISKNDILPTKISTEDLILSCMIGTIEGRYAATADILVALLQTDYNKGDMDIKIEREMSNLLEDIDPAYYKELIYIDIQKEMYA